MAFYIKYCRDCGGIASEFCENYHDIELMSWQDYYMIKEGTFC